MLVQLLAHALARIKRSARRVVLRDGGAPLLLRTSVDETT
jgi:hypothetical protein